MCVSAGICSTSLAEILQSRESILPEKCNCIYNSVQFCSTKKLRLITFFCFGLQAKIERAYFGLIAADENESTFNEYRYNEGLGLIVTISLLIIIFLTIVLIVIALVNKYRMRKLQKNNRRYDSNGYF